MTPTVWAQSLRGRAIDLLAPRAEDVDFREIADVLANAIRYAGNCEKPITVGLHTLIGLDILRAHQWDDMAAWWLLHDAAEYVLGDWISPVKEALREVARQTGGDKGAHFIDAVRRDLTARHDKAIHAAAGVRWPVPTAAGLEIERTDLIALATERRDFLSRSPRPWGIDTMHIKPHSQRYRARPAPAVADELFTAFKTYLPALQRAA